MNHRRRERRGGSCGFSRRSFLKKEKKGDSGLSVVFVRRRWRLMFGVGGCEGFGCKGDAGG